ncbi:class I SAM-dependent methyltransferase [Vibrio cholerae]|uniref:methyltransferase domain-containing protein n=1 Tax=Vibrio cholerae TaxID=666 RepID=UPI001A189757|nr:class I SAM-dependent methyltransferase [Vibrio cholerae]HAS3582874.1 class I SAM-dependent methyltransferase [Vibrio cholerae]
MFITYFNQIRIESLIKKHSVDFLDFGCSSGGSIEFAEKRFGGFKGLGIDISQKKVEKATSNGYLAINYNLNQLPHKELVSFCILSHFLEHIPQREQVKKFIESAIRISKDFVYIQQPFFDVDGYLFEKGLKLSWSDWSCHPNRMSSIELWAVLRDLKLIGLDFNFSILVYGKISNSSEKYILDINCPKDFLYKEDGEDILGNIELEGVYKEVICLISKPHVDHKQLLEKCRYDKIIFKDIKKPVCIDLNKV